MAKMTSAGFPLFGLSTTGGEQGEYVIVCGGGGSSKTGIKNGLILMKWGKEKGKQEEVEEVAKVELSGMAPTNVALGKDDPLSIYCGVEENCIQFIYTPKKDDDNIQEQHKFQTDFTPTNKDKPDQLPEQRICKIFDKERLFTGGFDGCVRVWSISSSPPSLQKELFHPSFEPSKESEQTYNKKIAICDFDLCPSPSSSFSSSLSPSLLSVCYDDGKLRLFDLEKKEILHQFNPFVKDYCFRSCRFSVSNDEVVMFTGERKHRSPSFLSKWYISGTKQIKKEKKEEKEEKEKQKIQPLSTILSNSLSNLLFLLTFTPSHLSPSRSLSPFSLLASRKVHKSFLTTITTCPHSNNNNKDLVLTAAADGSISSFFQDDLYPDVVLPNAHTFPVTGLGECEKGLLLSCSADHCYAVHVVGERPRKVDKMLVVLVSVLVLLLAFVISFIL